MKPLKEGERMDKYNELVNKKLELEEKISKIKFQIDEAKTKYLLTGVMSDIKWFNKAKYALEMNKLELKKVNAEYEKHKREMKIKAKEVNINNNKTFERMFMDICKEELTKEEYLRITSITKDRIGKVDNTVKRTIPKRWTLEEEEYLKRNYSNKTIEEMAIYLGRSESAIKNKFYIIKKIVHRL